VPLVGYIDSASRNLITGWAWNSDHPDTRLEVEIWVGSDKRSQTVADMYRADLEAARIGDGAHGFKYVPPGPLDLKRERLSARVAGTDFWLHQPAAIEPYDDSGRDELFRPVPPWEFVPRESCNFYHCLDFPDGETVEDAAWDIRGRFEPYIGDYPLRGKTVLDVGTASGFLAFSAEQAGASRVTAFDGLHSRDFERIPFTGSTFTDDRLRYIAESEIDFNKMKNGFWHAWHKKRSSVEVVYAPVNHLWRWDRKFDVVIAGAIVEHLSDPVSFIGSLARLATEAVILAGTQVVDTDRQLMETLNAWDDPRFNYSWWILSRGLYRRIFSNVGFTLEITTAISKCNIPGEPAEQEKPTIIARRSDSAT
jgi:2-polyprenyl-3-methyl-5-hydroxy-6-metoxy-1,4-benzoquinol methylase